MNKTHTIYISILILLVLIATGEFFYFHKKLNSQRLSGNKEEMKEVGKTRQGMGGMAMAPAKAPILSDQQSQQLKDGTNSAITEKTFNITGGNFYFVPNNITVNKGDKVTFVMTNAGGVHDIVIDELGVKTPVIRTGNAVSATFIASKTGSFIFYCDVMGHRAKGMWGTLIVQ